MPWPSLVALTSMNRPGILVSQYSIRRLSGGQVSEWLMNFSESRVLGMGMSSKMDVVDGVIAS